MKAVVEEVEYLEELLRAARAGEQVVPPELALDGKTAILLQQIRERATIWARELALPTKRDEEWRFTDLSGLMAVHFQAPLPVKVQELALAPLVLPEAGYRVVLVNGVYAPHLSTVEQAGILVVGNLSQLPEKYRERLELYLAKHPSNNEVFAAINTAGLTDAAVVWLPKNTKIETPIHLLFLSIAAEASVISQPRCLVVAEAGSSATLIEYYSTLDSLGCPGSSAGTYFANAVTEIWLEDNAEIVHIRVQREASQAFHIGKTALAQARNSRYTGYAICLGAVLSRHNWEVLQTGEGTTTILNGLSAIAGSQLADTHSAIFLNHPYGTCRQLHKCIVNDSARAVFNGKILVPKPAQMTDAAQLSRNLLLSPKARVDTKPQLEITADNVKCSHGATVSQLDAEEIFYLQSRGLSREMSCNLLIDAFATEIIQQIPVKSLQKMLSRCVACRQID